MKNQQGTQASLPKADLPQGTCSPRWSPVRSPRPPNEHDPWHGSWRQVGQDLLKVPQRSKELSSFSGPCAFILWGPQELINGHEPSMQPHCLGPQKPKSQSEARNRDPLDRAEEVLEEDAGPTVKSCGNATTAKDVQTQEIKMAPGSHRILTPC